MKYLGIDTTKKQSYLFLGDENEKIFKVLPPYEKHSETLMINIDNFLSENNTKLSDIDVFANVSGPGSFTGIRIGLAVIKAFAYAKNKKVVNLSVFDLLKDYVKNGLLLLECTSSSVYFANINKSKVVDYGVVDKKDLDKFIEDKEVFVLADEQISDDISYKVNVIDTYGEIANNQIQKAVMSKNFVDNPEPFYIQLSQAERALKEKESSEGK